MKTFILSLLCSLGLLQSALAQNTVDLTIRYNLTTARYEVYAIPTFTASSFLLGGAQITVVLPSAVANTPLSVSSISGGVWADNADVYAPGSLSTKDFHAVATLGSGSMRINFVANTPVLLFSFPLAEGCVSGVRLFINDADPGSSAAGMNNGDFRNNFYGTSSVAVGELYRTNTNNNGTSCAAECTLVPPTLGR